MPRLNRRLAKFFAWSFFLLVTIVLGGLAFAYSYVTDSATIAQIVRQHAPEYLPGCMVTPERVVDRAQAHEGAERC